MITNIDPQDSLQLRAHDGVYEAFETAYVRRVLRPWSVFVDVGAHIGYYSELAAETMDWTGTVFAFEPCPANFELLHRNVAAYGETVVIYDLAVGEAAGQEKLFLCESNSGDHRLFSTADRPSTLVYTTSLDLTLANVPKIDFLKIDVQGSEGRVLRGARNIIGRSPAIRGIVEYSPKHLCLAGETLPGFFKLFADLGLALYVREGERLVPANIPELLAYRRHLNLFFSKGAIE